MNKLDLDQYSPVKTDDNTIEYVLTDSKQLNDLLGGGLRTGNLVILQAPSGTGKTTFMMRLFIRALIAHKNVAYISIGEQDEKEILERIACMDSKIDYAQFIDERTEDQCEQVNHFIDLFKDQMHIYYSDDPFAPTEDKNGNVVIEMNEIMRDIISHNVKFVFIDYLGAVLAETQDSQYAYLTKLAAKLKNIATNRNIMIATAMQTNRQLKSALKTHDLDITSVDETYMADSIGPARKGTICMSLFQYNDKYYINLFKNRLNGKLGTIAIDLKPLSYQWIEYFNEKEGF